MFFSHFCLLPVKLTKIYRKLNVKVLLLLIVYLLVSATSLFIAPNTDTGQGNLFRFKPKSEYSYHPKRVANATLCESQHSVQRLLQNAALFFTVLLFSGLAAPAAGKFFDLSSPFLPDQHGTYLRHCVIRT